MLYSLHRIRRNYHQKLTQFIRLHDDFPGPRGVSNLDHEPTFQQIGAVPGGMFKHAAEVDFVKAAILHALQ